MRTRALKIIAAVALAACATAEASDTTAASAVAALGPASSQTAVWTLRKVLFTGPGTVLSQTAVWLPRKARFDVFTGCVVSDSVVDPCDNLRDEIRTILQKLGARDVVVTNYEATFSALEPADSAAAAPRNVQKVQARWDKVTLNADGVVMNIVKIRILPLLATRNLSQVSSKLSQRMTVEVLHPVSSAAP